MTPNPLEHADPQVARDFPPGKYWVIDPCMALSNDNYDEYLEIGGHGAVDFTFREHPTCVAGTEDGDGLYGCDLGDVSVESGRVAVMDARTVDDGIDHSVFGFLVDADAGMRVEFSRGKLDIGIHEGGRTEWHRIGEPDEEEQEEQEDEDEDDDPED